MSVAIPQLGSIEKPPPFAVRRFSVDEYHRMVQSGILTEDDPVELLDGWIVVKMPRNPRHDAAIEQTAEALRRLLPAGWRVRVQSAVTTGESEPEPDVAVVRGPVSKHKLRHPGPKEIGLVVEVSDASLERDREIKGRLYARARLPVYWIVNLVDDVLEVFSQPRGGRDTAAYRRHKIHHADSSVAVRLERKQVGEIQVSTLLP